MRTIRFITTYLLAIIVSVSFLLADESKKKQDDEPKLTPIQVVRKVDSEVYYKILDVCIKHTESELEKCLEEVAEEYIYGDYDNSGTFDAESAYNKNKEGILGIKSDDKD